MLQYVNAIFIIISKDFLCTILSSLIELFLFKATTPKNTNVMVIAILQEVDFIELLPI